MTTIQNCVNYLAGRDSGDPFQVVCRFAREKQDKVFDLTGAFAETIGSVIRSAEGQFVTENLQNACGFANGALSIPAVLGDTGGLIEKIDECREVFMKAKPNDPNAFSKKAHAIRQVFAGGADASITGLSLSMFLHEAEICQLPESTTEGMGIAVDALNITSCVSGIIDSVMDLDEVNKSEAGKRSEYRVKVDEMIKQKSIWEMVKNIASMTGSVLGIIGVITGVVLSSWITLGLAIVVFLGSIITFFTEDQLNRYQHDHVLDRIIASLRT